MIVRAILRCYLDIYEYYFYHYYQLHQGLTKIQMNEHTFTILFLIKSFEVMGRPHFNPDLKDRKLYL